MHLKIFIIGTVLLLGSCTVGKIHYDRIVYYSGNYSLPPDYREMFEVNIDSLGGSSRTVQGRSETNNAFSLSPEERKQLQSGIQKLPKEKNKAEFATGATTSGLSLMQGDSAVYTFTWQPKFHKIPPKIQQVETLILKLAPAPAPKQNKNNEGGGEGG